MEQQANQTRPSRDPSQRPSPNPIPRMLAVVALVAGAIVVVVVIVASTGGSDEGSDGGQASGQSRAQRERYCVVRAGDTFAAIAVEARVPETRLAQLNPNLDQFSIQPQNCVNLVPEGCKELSGGGSPNPCT
jgi:hypothetical protein